MVVRPRLMLSSLLFALVISVVLGWMASRGGGDGVPADEVLDDVRLEVPGEYQVPLDDLGTGGVGRKLPALGLVDADGNSVSTEDLIGSPAVINVWFAACPPCARELAEFAEVHDDLGEQVRFIGVNPFDPPASMVEFAAERGVTYELWSDPEGAFIDAIEVIGFPRTLFIDARGVIVAEAGVLDADQLRAAIEEVF